MKGRFGVFGRGLAWLYFSATILGLITGLGGGDSREGFFALMVLGVAATFSIRYFRKPRDRPLERADVVLHFVFIGWFVSTTIGLSGAYKSVLVEVPNGYIGAVVEGNQIREVITEPGLYLKSPFASSMKQQKTLGYEVTLSGFTSDGAKVPVLVRALATVAPENLHDIFRANPEGAKLAPIVEQALREAVARSATRYSEQEIDENRRNLETAVRESATSNLKVRFIDLKKVDVALFSPEDSVQ